MEICDTSFYFAYSLSVYISSIAGDLIFNNIAKSLNKYMKFNFGWAECEWISCNVSVDFGSHYYITSNPIHVQL